MLTYIKLRIKRRWRIWNLKHQAQALLHRMQYLTDTHPDLDDRIRMHGPTMRKMNREFVDVIEELRLIDRNHPDRR